jgi:putative transposase
MRLSTVPHSPGIFESLPASGCLTDSKPGPSPFSAKEKNRHSASARSRAGCPILAQQGWDSRCPSLLGAPSLRSKGGMAQSPREDYTGAFMPSGLVRFQKAGGFHFITFSCYHRLPLMARAGAYSTFEEELERVRQQYQFVIAGYVLMPEHVHLLVGEPQISSLATVLQVLKQRTSRMLKRPGEAQFWQRRYYDFNVRNPEKRSEKLRYMHRNPVKRGLVARPEDWSWSSFRHYATGVERPVEIESLWTARRRELRSSVVSHP